MQRMPPFALAALTASELAPPEMIDVASKTGYSQVGLRLIPVAPGSWAYPLMDDGAMLRETLARIAGTGVGVGDLEIAMLRPDTDVASFLPMLEVGGKLGAKHILVAGYDPEQTRLVETFAAFCDTAAPFGLTADLEFMPWTAVPNVAAAIRVVAAANHPNGGVLVDPLHFSRSDSTIAELGGLRREWLHYWQLCDAPVQESYTTEELLHTARAERLFPGEGGIDLVSLARVMTPDLPVSLEIPREELARTVGAEERARRAMESAKAVLARAWAGADAI
jgi:sugar phosphate isomerase/epimerase